ncbi:hypothetical protein KPA96_13845 [Burkholderia cenocepacia]|uniref:hypothetical protein n=1 Tax=Burkholderia cenocepacia TaxID=95486 RepID=UPI00285632D4|nr:hypothetical protein [Burkholderia cenocepacia]MDR8076740.1 hypothetical protein [Burkholderia cenocepacia]
MSEYSTIGVLKKDGTVEMSNCRYGGKLLGVGETLLNNYNDASKVNELISHGSIKRLGIDSATCEKYMGEQKTSLFANLDDYKEAWKSENNYLFDEEGKKWYYSKQRSKGGFEPLEKETIDSAKEDLLKHYIACYDHSPYETELNKQRIEESILKGVSFDNAKSKIRQFELDGAHSHTITEKLAFAESVYLRNKLLSQCVIKTQNTSKPKARMKI